MKIEALNLKYGDINIKQLSKVTKLGWKLDENLSGEAMGLKVINKINGRLRFLYKKKHVLIAICEKAFIQPYNSTALQLCLFSSVSKTKKNKSKLQTIQNKCIRFCLLLESKSHIEIKEFA